MEATDTADRGQLAKGLFDLIAAGGSDEAVAARVAALGEQLAAPARPVPLEQPPPHSIALSMATAVLAQPHLSVTFGHHNADEPALQVSNDALGAALGLPVWELEDLREDVDRRASAYLRQVRALNWMSSYIQRSGTTPERLFKILFPGTRSTSYAVRFAPHRARLHAVAGIGGSRPPLTRYLGWVDADKRPPRFEARYVDVGMRRSLSRAIGADDEETCALLDELITITPVEDMDAVVALDRWTSAGFAHVSGLGRSLGVSDWLTATLRGGDVDHSRWLAAVDGALGIRRVRPAFDRMALTRVTSMLRELYAGLLADLLAHGEVVPASQRLLFDVEARRLEVDAPQVRVLMNRVRSEWELQAARVWGGPEARGRRRAVQSLILLHMAATQHSLLREYARPADPRAPHRRTLLLFLADHFANAPLARLWGPTGRSDAPPPEDIIGEWFWPTWQRVLDFAGAEEIEVECL